MFLMCSSRRLVLCVLACCTHVIGQNVALIDDSSVYSLANLAGIQYSRTGWSPISSGDASKRYQATYTQSQVYGSQLWFAFRGSAISYYADRNPGFGAVTISIDGGDNINLNWTNPNTSTLYQQNIWNSGSLSPGDHTVVVGNTNVNNASIGLDYFAVLPVDGNGIQPQGYGPGASSVESGAVIVDDESNEVSYSGSAWERWITNSNATIQAMYFNRSEHCSQSPGSVATFTFNGTAVWYYTDSFSGSAKVKITIDGEEKETVNTATTGRAWTSQRLLWSALGLAPKPHTLTLTHVGANGDFACIDFFMYLPSSASPAIPASTPAPTATATPLSSSTSKSVPVGAIAGGTVGGVALIVLLIILAFLYRRRQSRKPENAPHHETYTGESAYRTKEVNPPYSANNLDHAPDSRFDQRPYSPYGNLGGGGSVAQTNWSGPTYRGHPELQ